MRHKEQVLNRGPGRDMIEARTSKMPLVMLVTEMLQVSKTSKACTTHRGRNLCRVAFLNVKQSNLIAVINKQLLDRHPMQVLRLPLTCLLLQKLFAFFAEKREFWWILVEGCWRTEWWTENSTILVTLVRSQSRKRGQLWHLDCLRPAPRMKRRSHLEASSYDMFLVSRNLQWFFNIFQMRDATWCCFAIQREVTPSYWGLLLLTFPIKIYINIIINNKYIWYL